MKIFMRTFCGVLLVMLVAAVLSGFGGITPGVALPIQVNGSAVGNASTLNLVGSTNMTLTPSFAAGVATVAFASTGGGGGGGNTITAGPCASLPASGQTAGNIYKCTDQPMQYIFLNATTAQAYFNDMPVTLPGACSGFTVINLQSSSACSNDANAALLVTDSNSTASCCQSQLFLKSAPATPYSYTTQFINNFGFNGGVTNVQQSGLGNGLAIRESSSGKFVDCRFIVGGGSPVGGGWNYERSDNSISYQVSYWPYQGRIGIKLGDDGTAFSCYGSADGGAHWVLIYRDVYAGFISTPDQVGLDHIIWEFGGPSVGPSISEFFDLTKGS